MEWTDDKVLQLIEEYQAMPVLWDPRNADYKLLNKKNDGWRLLAAMMETSVDEVKKKINSLLASFRRERSREKKKSKDANEEYKSPWFAYNSMTFLLDKFKGKNKRSLEGNGEESLYDDIEMHTTETVDDQDNEFSMQQQRQNQSTSSNSYLKRRANSILHNQSRNKKRVVQLKDVVDIMKSVCNKLGANNSGAHKSADDAFGEYIASKMRGYPYNTKSFVQHKINNILFEADMGIYEQQGHTDQELDITQETNSITD